MGAISVTGEIERDLFMKKTLMVTTALVAAGLFTTEAFAQAKPMSLTIGGYHAVAFTYNGADSSNGGFPAGTPDHQMDQGGEIWFKGATTLDNGLKIGFRAELETTSQTAFATGAGDMMDEVWIDFQGSFGRVIVGQFDPVTREMMIAAPYGALIEGVGIGLETVHAPTAAGTADRAVGTLGGPLWTLGGTSDAEKIVYFTPNFSGFMAGVSYMPSTTESIPGNDGFPRLRNSTINDVLDIGVEWKGKFDQVALGVFLGTQMATTGTTKVTGTNTRDAFQIGYAGSAFASVAGFTLGGSYQYFKQSFDVTGAGQQEPVNQTYDIGIGYVTGPWRFSAKYAGVNTESTTITSSDTEIQQYGVDGQYLLGPGVAVGAALFYEEHEDSAAAGAARPKVDGVGFNFGTNIAF